MRSVHLAARALLGLAVLASCSTMDVKTSYNPSAQFGRYRTYAWLPNTDRGQTADLMRGSPAEQRIMADVDKQLAARGIYQATAGQQPDFLVTYHVVLQQKLNVEDWGYGWGWGGPAEAYTYTQGTMIIDFIDPATNQAFWRGYASDIVDNPGSGSGKIDKAIAKMMEKYPPAGARNVASGYPGQ